jgi:hypothetical protein
MPQLWPPVPSVEYITPTIDLAGVSFAAGAALCRVGNVVTLAFTLNRTTQTGTLFELPPGWRPPASIFPIIGRTSSAERFSMQVFPDGTVAIVASLSSGAGGVACTYVATS